MTQERSIIPPSGTILNGPHWPALVCVVRTELRGTSHVLIETATLDDQSQFLSKVFKLEDLTSFQIDVASDCPTLEENPENFRLQGPQDRRDVRNLGLPKRSGHTAPGIEALRQTAALWESGARQELERFLAGRDMLPEVAKQDKLL